MNKAYTRKDVEDALDGLVTDGKLELVKTCVIELPVTLACLMVNHEFGNEQKFYRVKNHPDALREALEKISIKATQEWIRSLAKDALTSFEKLKSNSKKTASAKNALAEIYHSTDIREIKLITEPFVG